MNTKPDRLKKPVDISTAKRVPHTFVILFGIIILLGIATYFIPAGQYDTAVDESGRDLVVNGTYHSVESAPANPFDVFTSILSGMTDGAEIIFFLLIIGGSLGVLNATGAIDRLLQLILTKFAGKELWIIPILLGFFSLSGATFGMSEEAIPYLLIILPILLKIGFDRILIVALPLVGTAVGWAGAFTNPFNIGIAQQIAGLPIFSGMAVRIGLFIVLYLAAAIYFTLYGARILKDPSRSLIGIGPADDSFASPTSTDNPLTTRDIVILWVFIATIVAVPVGIIAFGWFITEMSALFVIMALVVAIIAKMNYNTVADSFTKGCQDLLVAALSVGLAYSGISLLENAHVIDTIIYGLSTAVGTLSSNWAAVGMAGAQSAINFIVTSGSGQAALTMPIMAPLADLVDVSRQTAVLAYQFGDGISNGFTPTNGAMMAGLAIGGVSWFKWVRFLWPLMVIFYVLGGIYIFIVHVFIWTV